MRLPDAAQRIESAGSLPSERVTVHGRRRELKARMWPAAFCAFAKRKYPSAALFALFVALLMAIPARYDMFHYSDEILYTKVSALVAGLSQKATHDAMVLAIDQRLFEDTFKGTSPLPRDALSRLIASLLSLQLVLVVDLDVSPRGLDLRDFDNHANCDTASPFDRRYPLEAMLCRQHQSGDSEARPLVLLTPFPTDAADALAKFNWMRFICYRTGADFAFGDLPDTNLPYMVRYFAAEYPTLASVGHAYLQGNTRTAAKRGLCRDVLLGKVEGALPAAFAFLDRTIAGAWHGSPVELHSHGGGKDMTELVNFRQVPFLIPLSEVFCSSGACMADASLQRISDNAFAGSKDFPASTLLFLGGTWDSGGDEFDTPLGRTSGVQLHALAAAGFAQRAGFIENVHEFYAPAAFALEVLAGFGMILLFKHLWLATDRHLEAIDDGGIRFRPLAKYLVGLIVVPCVASALMLLLIGSIALWYSAFLWIAPSAYMVSILFKTYLERHHRRDYKTAAAQILSHVPHMVLASWGSILWVSAMRGGR